MILYPRQLLFNIFCWFIFVSNFRGLDKSTKMKKIILLSTLLAGMFLAHSQIIVSKDSDKEIVHGIPEGYFMKEFAKDTFKNPTYYILIKSDTSTKFFSGKIEKTLTEVKILKFETSGGRPTIKTPLGIFYFPYSWDDEKPKRYFKDQSWQELIYIDF